MHTFDAVVEPLEWGRSRYTIIRVPEALVDDARVEGTRRVAGTIDGVAVNLGLAGAPHVEGSFVWAGASLLHRLGAAAGEPVRCVLGPVDPDVVPVPPDVAAALADADLAGRWESLSAATRRRLLVPVESARREETRARRVAALTTQVGGVSGRPGR